jgi:predicted NodU family carbamoyl transferase
MKILSVNISHHPSICVYENEKIIDFYNEERFVGIKDYDVGPPPEIYQSILQKINFKPSFVCYASYGSNYDYTLCDDQKIIKNLQNQLDNPPFYFNQKEHHLYHAISSFYFSDFNEAVSIVVDGGGACNLHIPYQEIQSIYYINKKNIKPIYKHHTRWRSNMVIGDQENSMINLKYIKGYFNKFSDMSVGGIEFDKACASLGYKDGHSAGKVMGLSSYGYCEKKYNLDYDKVEIAKKTQEKTFEETCELIEQAKQINNNILLSGGYFLNCSNNFKYVEKYPDLNFFVDPIPHDAGTAIGAALYYDIYK